MDDNIVGTRKEHMEYAKDLFRAMIREGLTTPWIGQVTVNVADDPELLELAEKSGCRGMFIGFESVSVEGLKEIKKRFNINKDRDLVRSVTKIRQKGIIVVGSFIIGLDSDKPGIGKVVAETAINYGVDISTVLMLTPLPGTKLWDEMRKEGRIQADRFPEDWRHYTLCEPVAVYKHFTWKEIVLEMNDFNRKYYALHRILYRSWRIFWNTRELIRAIYCLIGNLTSRRNNRLDYKLARKGNFEEIKWSHPSLVTAEKHDYLIRESCPPSSLRDDFSTVPGEELVVRKATESVMAMQER